MPYDSIRISRKGVVSEPMFIWKFWLVLMSITYHLVYYHDFSDTLYRPANRTQTVEKLVLRVVF